MTAVIMSKLAKNIKLLSTKPQICIIYATVNYVIVNELILIDNYRNGDNYKKIENFLVFIVILIPSKTQWKQLPQKVQL